MTADWRKPATGFGLLAVLAFAAQHPLTKPLLGSGADSLLVALLTSLLALLGLPVLFAMARGGRDCFAILASRRYWPALSAITLLGIASKLFYLGGLAGNHPVIVTLFLNTSVLWAALWSRLISGRSLPKAFFSTVVLAAIALAAPHVLAARDGGGIAIRPVDLLLLLVPAFYTLKSVLASRWFPGRDTIEVSASLNVASVFFLMPVLLLPRFHDGIGLSLRQSATVHWVEAGIGTLCGTVLGAAFYITALHKSEGRYAYVTAFNLLIPSLSALIGYGLSWVEPMAGVAPAWPQLAGIVLLLAALGRFTFLNWTARSSAESGRPSTSRS